MATPNIKEFLDSFKNTELARPSNFEVEIPIPTFLLNLTQEIGNMSFRCESAQLPTRTFSLVEQKTYGPVRFFPVQNSYENINLTFLCSDNMIEKSFFDNWMNFISVSYRNSTVDLFNVNSRLYFDFEYKDNYQQTITIKQKDVTGKSSYEIRLIEAYPISVNQLDLDWASVDNVHKLSVVFNYRYFERIPLNPKDILIDFIS